MAEQQAMSRFDDLRHVYDLLNELSDKIGGPRILGELSRYSDLPTRGVYFFFEPGESRRDSGSGPRVVRVGTHGLTDGSRSTLRQRLVQHRGIRSGDGNHRASIFRLLVGQALLADRDAATCPSWGVKGDAAKAADALGTTKGQVRSWEAPIEHEVSQRLWAMPFLWLRIEDDPSPNSQRGVIERNCIALLSNYERDQLDGASANWLGRKSNRLHVQRSGLWNQRHVEEQYDPDFLSNLKRYVAAT
jgi:hypothetical protein